eukprot:scaffold181278_cov16-Prasinocladus_malaysianus.AAC.1
MPTTIITRFEAQEAADLVVARKHGGEDGGLELGAGVAPAGLRGLPRHRVGPLDEGLAAQGEHRLHVLSR